MLVLRPAGVRRGLPERKGGRVLGRSVRIRTAVRTAPDMRRLGWPADLSQSPPPPHTFAQWGPPMTIPNLITIFRLILVPIVIVMIMKGRWLTAFVLFVTAGVSDGVDGFIARRYNMHSEFGAYIDPLADKALLVSIYVTLAIVGVLPSWLAIVVVSRDLMIVAAVVLSWVMARPVTIR